MRGDRTDLRGETQLITLGALACTLSPDELSRSLDSATALMRSACHADDCEVFLREPETDDLVLVACSGIHRESLMACGRFHIGHGFPGIVVAKSQTLTSRDIRRDRRFVRASLVRQGIRSFASVPIVSPTRTIGCLNVAWHDGSVDIDGAVELLTKAVIPIATMIRAGIAEARESVRRTLDALIDAPAESRGKSLLEIMTRTAGARAASLIVCGEREGEDPMVVSTSRGSDACADAVVDGVVTCPALRHGHGVSHGDSRPDWPGRCRNLPLSVAAPCCLPLISGDQLKGIVVLDRGRDPLDPPMRDLVPLLAMAAEGASRLGAEGGFAPACTSARRPVLKLRTFGKFEVRLHGQVISSEAFGRKKSLTLLKILVLSVGNSISRADLIEQLWPGAEEKAGANRLHVVLHALRAVVEPFHSQRRWIYVCNEGAFYHFNMESAHSIDLFEFRRHAAQAARAAAQGLESEEIDHLHSAVELYCGELFEDESDADWCAPQRVELANQYADMTLRLAEHEIGAGEAERGIELLRRGLLADPCREDLHQTLMLTLADCGRRREALEQYRKCERLLQEEIGVEPLPATRRLGRLLVGTP